MKRKRSAITSAKLASIAARGIKDPWDLSPNEVQAVCAAVLRQRESAAKRARRAARAR